MKNKLKLLSTLVVLSLLTGCSENTTKPTETNTKTEATESSVTTALAKIDQSKWNYNTEDDVYWQVGISYCSKPADTQYETLGIYVPGAYMDAKENEDGINRNETSSGVTLSGTYETVQDYIDALNATTEWVTYDKKTNIATITSIADFVKACKNASKNVGAFDDLNKTQGENVLFGYGDGNGAHFDPVMAEILSDNKDYGQAYKEDLEKKDALGNTVNYRLNMYNPMYYLSDYYDGYKTANVAKYWRIRSGINQGDTALSTEVNLALALKNYEDTNVDFETVWGQGHVQAERTGDSSANFIAWVNACLK